MEELTGYIEHIIFSNSENGYTVFVLTTDTEEITCVGNLHAVSEGEHLRIKGERVTHQIYGEQIKIASYDIVEPTDEEAILKYLSQGAVKGVGAALAKRIVDMFGEDSLRVIEEEPELLVSVKGISNRKAQEIASCILEKRDLRRIMMFAATFGISNNLAIKIYSKYGAEAVSIIEENPYRLAEEIDGVGFKTADEIAMKLGLNIDSDYRCASGVIYTLGTAVADGHTYLPMDELIGRSAKLLEVPDDNIRLITENLSMDRKIIIRTVDDEVRVYSKRFYYMELDVARKLIDLSIPAMHDDGTVEAVLKMIAKREDIDTDEVQLEAAKNAILNGISVITGGPGTGKTTTINLILKYFEFENADIFLAAPTGRAAKRMTEATGYEASTIQRLLGLGKNGTLVGGFAYEKNEDNPLEADAIVIDEMSMVDLPLMNALLHAIVPGTRLIMVGDVNQLPSVGPGRVLKDIIESGKFYTSRLNRIYRQESESDIVTNAHLVNAGRMPDLKKKSNDFFFLEREDVNVILKHMVQLITEKLPPYVGANPFELQVLTPMRKGPLGAKTLNPILQKFLNPAADSKKEYTTADGVFREGDKVMQIKNNYQLEWEVCGNYGIAYDRGLGVFNGDVGVIQSINEYSETVEVLFEENHLVRYPYALLDELELAYAVTIHKSQGSEYPAIIIPLLSGPAMLMNRNLLYTAITRAKKSVVLLGKSEVFKQMVENKEAKSRYSGLKDALEEMN